MALFPEKNKQLKGPVGIAAFGPAGLLKEQAEKGFGGAESQFLPFTKLLPRSLRGPAVEAVTRNLDLLDEIGRTGQTEAAGRLFDIGRTQTLSQFGRATQRAGFTLSPTGPQTAAAPLSRFQSLSSSLLNSLALIDAQRQIGLRRQQVQAGQMQIENLIGLSRGGRLEAASPQAQASPLWGLSGQFAGQALNQFQQNRAGAAAI